MVAAAMATAIGIVVAAPPAQAASCRTAAQSVTERNGIACRSAKRVFGNVSAAANRGGAKLPECRGDYALEFLGWKASAAPIGPGGQGIGTKFAKGRQSFRVSGGGAC
jgi:hypothetical protein